MYTLSNIELFSSLEGNKLRKLETACSWSPYEINTQIIDRQSRSTNIFFVTKGTVRVVNYSLSGREVSFGDVESGGYFGELAAIDSRPRSASVVALSFCELAMLKQKDFLTLLDEEPTVSRLLIENLTVTVRNATDRIMELSTVAANNRVQFELLRRAQKFLLTNNCSEIRPIPLHSEIASSVSTTRETVSRVMNDLARRGLVERKKNSILIKDLNGLQELINETQII